MTTVKQLERQWNARTYGKLFQQLLAARPEGVFPFDAQSCLTSRAAALTLIRLDELTQSHAPLATTLVRTLITTQDADGGWGDPPTTALCLRALLCSNGTGAVIDRGLAYLANLQKAEGIWPSIPLRRMPADACVSAFILYQLGDHPRFRAAVRFEDALAWFARHGGSLDAASTRTWERATLRCRNPLPALPAPAALAMS